MEGQSYYKILEVAGEGTYGTVYKCGVKDSKDNVAVKVVKGKVGRHTVGDASKKEHRELAVLRKISERQCPHVIHLMDYFHSLHSGRLCLVFEYAPKTLLQRIEESPGGLPEREVKKIVWQLLCGLKTLHDMGLVHRDIKPENLLINSQGIVKLCDFGFAREVGTCMHDHDSMTKYVATRWYRAPELLLKRDAYSFPVDVWALGCLCVELLTGNAAFPGTTEVDQLHLVVDFAGKPKAISYREEVILSHCVKRLKGINQSRSLRDRIKMLSEEARNFIMSCLRSNPSERLNIEDLLSHSWLQRDLESINNAYFRNVLTSNMQQIQKLRGLIASHKRIHLATRKNEQKKGDIPQLKSMTPQASTVRLARKSILSTPVGARLSQQPVKSTGAITHLRCIETRAQKFYQDRVSKNYKPQDNSPYLQMPIHLLRDLKLTNDHCPQKNLTPTDESNLEPMLPEESVFAKTSRPLADGTISVSVQSNYKNDLDPMSSKRTVDSSKDRGLLRSLLRFGSKK